MSLDRSLKSASSLVRHRNVLKRDERMKRMKDEEKWAEGRSIFGLPKVANRKAAIAKAVKEEGDAAATPTAAGAAPAGASAPGAKGGKAAAPAAKAGAPAAKGAAPAAKAAAPAAKKK